MHSLKQGKVLNFPSTTLDDVMWTRTDNGTKQNEWSNEVSE